MRLHCPLRRVSRLSTRGYRGPLLIRVHASFILANTEQLHSKIVQMSDHIRLLEDALETLQSQCSSQAHPLLAPEHLLVKSSLELYGINAHGPHAARQSVHSDGSDSSPQPDFGASSLSCSSLSPPGEEFYGQTAKAEVSSASTPCQLHRLIAHLRAGGRSFC